MQPLSISAPPVAMSPIGADVSLVPLTTVGDQSEASPFAMLLQGRTLAADRHPLAQPQSDLALSTRALDLPPASFAGPGKTLPLPGNPAASNERAHMRIGVRGEEVADADATVSVPSINDAQPHPSIATLPTLPDAEATPTVDRPAPLSSQLLPDASARLASLLTVTIDFANPAPELGGNTSLSAAGGLPFSRVASSVAAAARNSLAGGDKATGIGIAKHDGPTPSYPLPAAPIAIGPTKGVHAGASLDPEPSNVAGPNSLAVTVSAPPALPPIAVDHVAHDTAVLKRAVGGAMASSEQAQSNDFVVEREAKPAKAIAVSTLADGLRGEERPHPEPSAALRAFTHSDHSEVQAGLSPLLRASSYTEVAAASPAASFHPAVQTATTTDRAEVIASLVERLALARETGAGTLASVAVANRDLGEITVNFAHHDRSLEVSLSARDAESQQALAAALGNAERVGARDHSSQPNHSGAQNTGLASPERSTDGQTNRNGGDTQDRSEAERNPRATQAQAPLSQNSEDEAAAPVRGGIYV